MTSDLTGIILSMGLFMALINAYCMSLVSPTQASTDFQLKIELNIKGGQQ